MSHFLTFYKIPTAIMDATTCQHDWPCLAMGCLLWPAVLTSPGYLLLPLSAKARLSVGNLLRPMWARPTLMQALYAFQTSPHLSSYSFVLALVRCATQSCSEILAGRSSGVKYDSSHALKQESYSAFKGVHSLLRLCDICVRINYGRVQRYCFVRRTPVICLLCRGSVTSMLCQQNVSTCARLTRLL